MYSRASNVYLCFFVLIVATSLLLSTTVESRPSSSEVQNVAEALRYLEEIDKYYSQMARPRFGRSVRSYVKSAAAKKISKPLNEDPDLANGNFR